MSIERTLSIIKPDAASVSARFACLLIRRAGFRATPKAAWMQAINPFASARHIFLRVWPLKDAI